MTAAPGPQQPDEVQARVDEVAQAMCRIEVRRTGRSFDEAVAPGIQLWVRHRYEAEQLIAELPHLLSPAAPSAQPDEDRCECGHTWEDEHEQTSLMGGKCTPHNGTACDCPRFTPAQPVRDTEEGRR